MLVREVMTSDVKYIHPDTSIKDAAVEMEALDAGALPVGENDRLVGMLTDRDIVLRTVAKGKDPSKIKVRDAMSEGIHYCFDDQDLKQAADQMKSEKVRRLAVVNRDKRLVGVCSIGDIVVLGDKATGGEVLEKVSEGVKAGS